jgi:RHH-type proline utilization regulon transcriptional repressor/proline dehydrogenase/delta 1-pyrroline-5-carboxylate dehydrogenase
MEKKRGLFLGLLIKEGKKTLADAVSELREAADFCRYYAAESLKHFATPQSLHGPTGERNELLLRGRGVFACISPWNFPMAIFTGQVVAALASGNAAIAKPANLTPLIGFHVVQALHEAGVPKAVLHLLPGPSRILGDPLLSDQRISGVVFTGSTASAHKIQKILAERGGPIVPFIAETGGLNAMIVDSSALIEQVVDDVISSAFQSAGQRCSALRILFLQEEIYDQTLHMLREAMEALNVGDPALLSTDVGPVIDGNARDEIETYVAQHTVLSRTNIQGLAGTYVAPTLIEVGGMGDVKREVFGPILHVARFKAKELDDVVQSINQAGYGLTMGLQSRIESTIEAVRSNARVGNLYVNRNIIGAVVGVQPFGGEGLSGSGPKAGGPYYLPRFAVERTFTYNITASGGNVTLLNVEEV